MLIKTIKNILLEYSSDRKIGYHISKSKNDDNILENGINSDKEGRIYVWLNEGIAEWFGEQHSENEYGDYQEVTKWTLDLSGLVLHRDPEAEDMSRWSSRFGEGEFGEGYIIYADTIEPSRIIEYEKI